MGGLGNWTYRACTIAINGNLSGALAIAGFRVVGIVSPAAWTTADIAIQLKPDDNLGYLKVMDQAGEIVKFKTIQTAEARVHLLGSTEAANVGGGIPYICGAYVKLHSIDTADETDETQVAERTLYVILEPLD